jgi:hypothetical protein
VVEHRLAKARVASSNLVSRSNPPSGLPAGLATADSEPFQFFRQPCQGRGTQAVRERSAKPLCVGSIPTRASNSSPQIRSFLERACLADEQYSKGLQP